VTERRDRTPLPAAMVSRRTARVLPHLRPCNRLRIWLIQLEGPPCDQLLLSRSYARPPCRRAPNIPTVFTLWCEPRNAAGPSNPLCIGFVVGVSDAVNFSRQFTGKGTNTSCTPPGVTMSQEADVVLSYLNRNPDKRDLAAAALVVAAMDEAWCPRAPAVPSVQYKPH
jgi:hypothetical protein